VSQALYRKWRPRTFHEVVDQEHITRTLCNAVSSSRIVHAYLFSGPRGTGKTSTARILAKAVNCLSESDDKPCNECEQCRAIDDGRAIDLIEIDAASHTGVDDIRDLRDRISFSPSESRHKIYIIDEVHMLSPSAFNALLKTLEEPPEHAILVLATTEPHKIPSTVLSRCQRFDFRPIRLQAMIGRLREIAHQEGLEVHEDALDLIARQSTGSMRDAESFLDQLASYGGMEITLDQVRTMLGAVSSQAVKDLVDHLAAGDVAAGLNQIGDAIADGADPRQLNKELLGYLRGLLLMKATGRAPSDMTDEQQDEMERQAKHFSLDSLVRTIKAFNEAALDVKGSTQPQLPLELAFVEALLGEELDAGTNCTESVTESSRPSAITERQRPVAHTDPPPHPRSKPPPPESTPRLNTESPPRDLEGLQAAWSELVADIKRSSRNVAAIAISCLPVALEGDLVILRAPSRFHREQLESDPAKRLVEQVVSELLGEQYRIRCVTTPETPAAGTAETDLDSLTEDPVIKKAVVDLGAEIGNIQ
jgi:DNA polymerase-3 subunit gamma/tau